MWIGDQPLVIGTHAPSLSFVAVKLCYSANYGVALINKPQLLGKPSFSKCLCCEYHVRQVRQCDAWAACMSWKMVF